MVIDFDNPPRTVEPPRSRRFSASYGIIFPQMKITRRDFCSEAVATLVVTGVDYAAFSAETSVRAKPFVKWAGGKSQLIGQLEGLFPSDFANREDLTYIEPFVGGGALLFHVLSRYPNIRHTIINDFNADLVETYRAVQSAPEELIVELSKLQSDYWGCANEAARRSYYYAQRAAFNGRAHTGVRTAALFIFLNRTCFNGLYRVNSKGEFNVPWGKAKHPLICDEGTIRADSRLLQRVEILQGDFEGVSEHIKGKAFFYLDPPYRPLPDTQSFTAYSKNGFNDNEQRRLAQFCRRMDGKGHLWLLSNSDPTNTDANDMFFDDLFVGFDINRVSASRMINSNPTGRGKITELAIRNYKE